MMTGLILSGVLALALELPPPPAQATPRPGAKAESPYFGLFDPAQGPKARPPKIPRFEVPGGLPAPRTKIVCGTTLIIVGSPVDEEMVKPVPESDVRYTMRRVPPPACGKDEKRK